MSNWKSIEKDDIDIDEKEEELNIYIGSDDFGNNYVCVKIKDIRELLEEYDKKSSPLKEEK